MGSLFRFSIQRAARRDFVHDCRCYHGVTGMPINFVVIYSARSNHFANIRIEFVLFLVWHWYCYAAEWHSSTTHKAAEGSDGIEMLHFRSLTGAPITKSVRWTGWKLSRLTITELRTFVIAISLLAFSYFIVSSLHCIAVAWPSVHFISSRGVILV